MSAYRHILLASHGTAGARAAERAALALAGAGAQLSQLVVVPDFWKGMMGDDWLNNASTRDVYARHVERQLEREIEAEVARVRADAAARGLRYARQIVLGRPAECLVDCASRLRPDLVVIGSPRPPRAKGLRSRMDPDTLLRGLVVPLLVVPYPR
ncbi:MAG: universal stress protein [Betaproteobacteria bacterium]|nr:MAG: universal stress protein [Betaproteobacteria bacterium]